MHALAILMRGELTQAYTGQRDQSYSIDIHSTFQHHMLAYERNVDIAGLLNTSMMGNLSACGIACTDTVTLHAQLQAVIDNVSRCDARRSHLATR
jgi:hypothetical protein